MQLNRGVTTPTYIRLATVQLTRVFHTQKALRGLIGTRLPVLNFSGAGAYAITIWTCAYGEHPAIGKPVMIELDAASVLLKVNGKGPNASSSGTSPPMIASGTTANMKITTIPVPSDIAEAALAAEGFTTGLSPARKAMHPLVIVWLAAGALRGPKRNLNRRHAMKSLAELTGYAPRSVRQYIKDGDGILWKVQRHVISFKGVERVRSLLGCKTKHVTVTCIPVEQFRQGRASRRAALLSAAIQPGRLESRLSIARRTCVSATTSRRYDRQLGYVKRERHIADITGVVGNNVIDRQRIADKLEYAGAFVAGDRSVYKTLPNSYTPNAQTTPKTVHQHPHQAAPQETPGQHIDIVLNDREDECRRVVFFGTSKQWRRCKARKAGTTTGADSRYPNMAYIRTGTRGGVGWYVAIADYGVEVA